MARSGTEVLAPWRKGIADGLFSLIFGDGLQPTNFVGTPDVARSKVPAEVCDVTEGVYDIASGQ